MSQLIMETLGLQEVFLPIGIQFQSLQRANIKQHLLAEVVFTSQLIMETLGLKKQQVNLGRVFHFHLQANIKL